VGERSIIAAIHSQLLKHKTKQRRAFIGLSWPSSPSSAFYTRISARPHSTGTRPNDMPIPHPARAAHRLAPHAAPRRLAPNGRGSIAATNTLLEHLDKRHGRARPPCDSALPLDICDCQSSDFFRAYNSKPTKDGTLLRRPPHPLQVQGQLSTTSLHASRDRQASDGLA